MDNNVPQAKSPPHSAGSSTLSCTPSSSSRESSPSFQTSSSDIDLICGTPDSSGRQELRSAAMEHPNRSFDSRNSHCNKNPPFDPATTGTGTFTVTGAVTGTTTSSPRNPGFHNNTALPTSSPSSANPRNIPTTVPSTPGLFSTRSLTSANWRNTNIATSSSERDTSYLASYGSNDPAVQPILTQNYYHYHNLNRLRPGTTAHMSSSSSPPTSTSSTMARNGQGTSSDVVASANTNNPGGNSGGDAFALTQLSQALVQTTTAQPHEQHQQQQVGGRGAGQTDMPCFAYCFDRGNGQYTRLIPADMLPPLADIPALQQGCMGMTVLPCPTGLAPNGRSSNLERVFIQPVQQFPAGQIRSGNMRDPIQSRIDTIIAASPAPETQKRQKIYCDKWIHEGVCAFTQQGCKYKHEMPLDKDTQESLGLFQGLPSWWRKHQGEIANDCSTTTPQQAGPMTAVMDSPPALPSGGGRARGISASGRGGFGGANRLRQNTWRSHQGGTQGPQGQVVQTRGHSGSVSSGSQGGGAGGQGGGRQQQVVAQFSSPFGPIAPPSASTKRDFEATPNTASTSAPTGRSVFADHNPWNVLQVEQGDSGEEEGGQRG